MEACKFMVSANIPPICSQPPQRIVAPVRARSFRVRASGLSGGVYTPLEVRSPAGKYLSTVLRGKDRETFESAVKGQLLRLSEDNEKATEIMSSIETIETRSRSDELRMCRSITEGLKKKIDLEVEEAMYLLICRRFFDAGVYMLPRISGCIAEGRLELSTSKDCLLEHVHIPEVLEFVRLFVNQVTGLHADASVRDYWKLIELDHSFLTTLYTTSLLRSHFLKSASSRYSLELLVNDEPEQTCSFYSYVLSFPPGLRHIHSVPKSIEAKNMMNKHLEALFGQVKTHLASTQGLVKTSPGSLRRLALEGFAFGSFLWDAEYYVNKFYKLDDEHFLSIP